MQKFVKQRNAYLVNVVNFSYFWVMNFAQYIESDHQVMLGKPIVKGTRITVELILKKLSEGASVNELIAVYPNLTEVQIRACLEYASLVVSQELVLPD